MELTGKKKRMYHWETVGGVKTKVYDFPLTHTKCVYGSRDSVTHETALESGNKIASGKTYGTPASPIAITAVDSTEVTTESVLYFSISGETTFNYLYSLNDAPTSSGNYVMSVEDGVAVFGTLTPKE